MEPDTWKGLFVFIFHHKKREIIYRLEGIINNIIDFIIVPLRLTYSILFFAWSLTWFPVKLVKCIIIFIKYNNSKKTEKQQLSEV